MGTIRDPKPPAAQVSTSEPWTRYQKAAAYALGYDGTFPFVVAMRRRLLEGFSLTNAQVEALFRCRAHALRMGVLVRREVDARTLYRRLAKLLHPDMATSDADRATRHVAMVDLNLAYERGDIRRLKQLAVEVGLKW